ncbi:unnamed protein product, partial [Prorocentrum cordatum]
LERGRRAARASLSLLPSADGPCAAGAGRPAGRLAAAGPRRRSRRAAETGVTAPFAASRAMEDVDLLLRALRLEQYAPRFEAEGWDDTDFLQSLDGQALTDLARSVGMKPGHADRFVRNASKVNFRTQAAPAHHRGPEAVTRALIALRLDMYAAQFQDQGSQGDGGADPEIGQQCI